MPKTCPTCNGTKKQTVIAKMLTDKGWSDQPPVVMDCFNCKGKGFLTEQEVADKEAQDNLWCKCEDDKGSTYVDDNVSEICDKHHWVCNGCGKVTQVG